MVPQQVSFVEQSSLSQRVPYQRFHCIIINSNISHMYIPISINPLTQKLAKTNTYEVSYYYVYISEGIFHQKLTKTVDSLALYVHNVKLNFIMLTQH